MKVGVQSPVAVIKAAIKQANDTEIVLMDSPPALLVRLFKQLIKLIM